MPTLSKKTVLTVVISTVLVAILCVVAYVISRRPYVQYEEGAVYKSGNVSIVSLRLENKGSFNAEQVFVEVIFPEPITDIVTSDSLSSFTTTSGGKGLKIAGGSLSRITPSQVVFIYFTIDNSTGRIGQALPGFVKQVTFNNGKASTEPPPWVRLLVNSAGVLVGLIFATLTYRYIDQSARLKHMAYMSSQILEMAEKMQLDQQLGNNKEKTEHEQKAISNRTKNKKRKKQRKHQSQ